MPSQTALPRLQRLFAEDGKCLNVAVDHGLFHEASFLQGIEDMPHTVRTLAAAGPDAIQLSLGEAPLLQALLGKSKPALVVRTDVANVYGRTLPRHLYSHLVDGAVEEAVRLDAAAVVVNLFMLPDQPELHEATVANVTRLRRACSEVGMPLIVEPLVMRVDAGGGYGVDGDPVKVVTLVRQAAELGADVIKADPTDPPDEYHRVVEAAGGCPVLPRGGGRADVHAVLERTRLLLDQGARGIVYGRNIIQHPRPHAMVRALMAIVHEGATVAQAEAYLAEGAD
jgi:class I fructose-bisphosphate aldolase